jgi:hypothetical protein
MTRIYKTSYKTRRGVKRFGIEFTGDKLSLIEKIENEQKFIETYPNYPTLCDEARIRLDFYERRLAELHKAEPTSYKDRHVPGKTCPICGITLTVNETQFKTEDPKHPFIVRRLVCPNWWTTGCQYKEKWTDEIEAELIEVAAKLAALPAEF